MDLQLGGHTAVVVGGARGIGLAIATEFHREGARAALIDQAAEVSEVARRMAFHGHPALGFAADVLDDAALRLAARQIHDDCGRIDHLVFAAGIGSGKFGFPFWNLEPTDWSRVLQVNVLGAVNTLHAFVPHLIEAKDATVLLIASVAGQIGSQTDPPYSASKAALINFAQCAAKDLAPYNVRVNTLCPGMVQTALNRAVWQAWHDQQPPEQRLSYEDWTADKIRRVVPLNRWQEPEDMAAMAVFLASPRARNVCGQTLNVDGGFVMHW
ncbi:MAG: SDR family oxidoreductase [Gemmataceae bacterium]|nr:SDR family oxidoreductase [Gemmataceae bacterium]